MSIYSNAEKINKSKADLNEIRDNKSSNNQNQNPNLSLNLLENNNINLNNLNNNNININNNNNNNTNPISFNYKQIINIDLLNGKSKNNININNINTSNENIIKSQNSNCSKCGKKDDITICDNCGIRICERCADKCTNKKSNHVNKKFCSSCLNICSLCDMNKNCKDCIKNCFSKLCNNLFCVVCFDKNKHQIRKEDSKCRFYRCEACNVDSNCIIQTLYCATCDKRVCYKCLKKDHTGHINFN